MNKEMEPTIKKMKWKYSSLVVDRKTGNHGQAFGDGFYRHNSGLCCRFYFEAGHHNIPTYTTLDVQWNGVCYMKNYKCLFSDRGLMLISASFIKEIIAGKI